MKITKKVKVGDYVNLLDTDFDEVGWFSRNYSKYIKWPWINFKYWFQSQIYQRIRYGFPLEDTWSFYTKHAEWCIPRLKLYRKSTFGYSGWLSSDGDFNQRKFDFYGDIPNHEYNKKKWNEILDKIIWAFENVDKEPYPIPPPNYDGRWKVAAISENGDITYTNADDRPWDYSQRDEHKRKVKEGLDLFAKYYLSIWD